MVVDSSAIVAILLKESDRDQLVEAIENDSVRLISSVNALESAMVLESRKREAGGREFDLFLYRAKISVVPMTEEQFELARQAWRRYGKGNHPASLNLADCCAYSLARSSGEPLLFKGQDFTLTDVVPALKPANLLTFSRPLESAFRDKGFFNVQSADDQAGRFGPHGSTIQVYVADSTSPVHGVVDRKANRNGTPRIGRCHSELRAYFRDFQVGDTINVEVLAENRIRLWCTRHD